MNKILKAENVNTEFNIYHKYLIKKYKNKTIKEFNKEMTKTIQKGFSRVSVRAAKPGMLTTFDSAMVENAMEEGYQQGLEEISKVYPIVVNKDRSRHFDLKGEVDD